MSINLIKSFFFSKAQAPTYPLVQTTIPQPTASTPTTTSTNEPAKSSAKTKKKKFAFDGLSRSAIISQLKQQWKDEEEATNADLDDDQESRHPLKPLLQIILIIHIIKSYLDMIKIPHQT